MSRWCYFIAAFNLACLQTEPVELSVGDATSETESDTGNDPDVGVDTTPDLSNDALAAPCINVTPLEISFGGVFVGDVRRERLTIASCGELPLVISELSLASDADGQFALSSDDEAALPLTLRPGEAMSADVSFAPTHIAAVGADGPTLETTAISLRSNAPEGLVTVHVNGYGASSCPVAVIDSMEGGNVLPQTQIHLDGSRSTSPNGPIVGFEWRVSQPAGSVSTLMPSASVAAPTFAANFVGAYRFELSVIDDTGRRSCVAAAYDVIVTSGDAIRVEVRWDTPGDPDQSDTSNDGISSAGADVDLHFLHPKAQGEYFGSYDCYFANTNPEWGIFDPSDNPRLDRDDNDGAGPEVLSLRVPEQNVRFQVAAHYYNDWGYGDSAVTISVYIYGVLRDQWSDVWLTTNDMWASHTIDWPSGVVTRIGDGEPSITRVVHGEP